MFDTLQKQMEKELDPERYRHTLGVMYTAAALAMCHAPALMEKARLAGLLHDCAKCVPAKEQYAICLENGIALSRAEEQNPALLHAKTGAWLAKNKYHIDGEDIQHAISVHTTGCPDMSMLDMFVYIADYIEPDRDSAPHLDEIRRMAFRDLEQTVEKIAFDVLEHLKTKNSVIDEMTAATWEWYHQLCAKAHL